MSFDCISLPCQLGGKCDHKHRCARCDGHMHTICGQPLDEDDPKWSNTYSAVCNNCHRGSSGNNKEDAAAAEDDDSSEVDDDIPLAALDRNLKKRPEPEPEPKQQSPKQRKKKKRAERPAANYQDDRTADPSA